MAKSKNHTAHNQTYKAHKRGIQKVKVNKYSSTRGVSDAARSCVSGPVQPKVPSNLHVRC